MVELEFKIDPEPDSSTQPKARGLLHMECEYLSHPIHAHKILKNIKTTWAGAPHGLDARFEGCTQRLVTTQP